MAGDAYCPSCGGALACDSVDIGVGLMQGPLYCTDCGWNENSGPEENPFDNPADFIGIDFGLDDIPKDGRRSSRRRAKESG